MRRNFQLVAALSAAALLLACGEAQAQRREPSEATVSGTEHFGDKPPPKAVLGPASEKPITAKKTPGRGSVNTYYYWYAESNRWRCVERPFQHMRAAERLRVVHQRLLLADMPDGRLPREICRQLQQLHS